MDKDSNAKVSKCNRRDFLQLGAAAGLGAALSGLSLSGCAQLQRGAFSPVKAKALPTVRIGVVGVGNRGRGLSKILMNIDNVEIRAVCDIVPEKADRIKKDMTEKGKKAPVLYTRDKIDYKRMCQRDDLDLIITATPWKLHTPVCVAAMKAGKHAATEVPAAVSVEQCWQLVETFEKTRKHCVMLENVCYGRSEMMVLNMVRQGIFGQVIHGECGYLHDLRYNKLNHEYYGDRWRLKYSIEHDGNPYPTHGLGPIAQCMNVNRGDKFEYLVSMSNNSQGLNLAAAKEFGADSPDAMRKYALGDVNVSLLKTAKGHTITLYHDTSTPRPYSRINMVQGTKAIFRGYPDRIHIEGKSPAHQWESVEEYLKEYDHPLWRKQGEKAHGAGHGGMDYMELYRLVKTLREGVYPDMDVYDAADWSVIVELSERSVLSKSRPVDFPDFTRGGWKTRKPLGIIEA